MRKSSKHGTGPTFSERVVRAARSIPAGRVTTYGRIARAAGAGGMAAQSITTILSKAWDAGIHDIPWHRIVYADGRIWIDDGHRAERMRLYKQEGITIDARTNKVADFQRLLVEFT